MFQIFLTTALILTACGEKDGAQVPINITGASAFSDPAVSDVVFEVTNVPSGGFILDLNKDGSPDRFAFPSTCDGSFQANCGIPAGSAAVVNVGNLPLNFLYQIEARFRNSAGQVLYSGSSQFTNDKTLTSIAVIVLAPSPPS
ncbi:MAG TPA: hypothetical protein VI895_09220 [Bdellovibrionota bacterium]|nr:hypothetical protein [Bdellovibrionota bacterium]